MPKNTDKKRREMKEDLLNNMPRKEFLKKYEITPRHFQRLRKEHGMPLPRMGARKEEPIEIENKNTEVEIVEEKSILPPLNEDIRTEPEFVCGTCHANGVLQEVTNKNKFCPNCGDSLNW